MPGRLSALPRHLARQRITSGRSAPDRDLVGVDGSAIVRTQPSGLQDALDHRVLPRAIRIDVRSLGADPLLDLAILVTEPMVRPQNIANCQMVPQRKRARDDHIRVRACESSGFVEGPALRNAQLSERLEPKPDENRGGRLDIGFFDDDVAVDDRLPRKAWDGGAAHVLDGDAAAAVARYGDDTNAISLKVFPSQ